MKRKKDNTLEKALATISSQGIRADRKHLLEDIGSQFSNYREWIREYVVNASDAGATMCRVWGEEKEETLTIHVSDNGQGMDRQRVLDFMMLFRSVKDGDPRKAVGRFGVGKASILAIPGLIELAMETSTGSEGWKMDTCSLLDDKPVHIHRIEQPGEAGTSFAVTFRKAVSLSEELLNLGDVLSLYVRYLPMTITVQNPISNHPGSPQFRYINDQWSAYRERLGRKYTFTIKGYSFEAILGMGRESHEIYQNHVLVTDRYNLFFYDMGNSITLPGLSIRVDSPDFELPFGRHGLRNEEILVPLARYLRKTVLPQYFDELVTASQATPGMETEVYVNEVEDLAVALLRFDAHRRRKWSRISLFNVWGYGRLSFSRLLELVYEKGCVYLEDTSSVGADYAVFNAPVLLHAQPAGGLDFLQKYFGKNLLNLSDEDMVLEQTKSNGKKLSPEELVFESALGFHPEMLANYQRQEKIVSGADVDPFKSGEAAEQFIRAMAALQNIGPEARNARNELEDLEWRVDYLVERDGVTPCWRQKFLYRDNSVVLNLYHPEVKRLFELSRTVPALAGHWALAMCLQDSRKMLSHLTPEAREELIKLDAMARCHTMEPPSKKRKKEDRKSHAQLDFRDHLRMLASYSGLSGNDVLDL